MNISFYVFQFCPVKITWRIRKCAEPVLSLLNRRRRKILRTFKPVCCLCASFLDVSKIVMLLILHPVDNLLMIKLDNFFFKDDLLAKTSGICQLRKRCDQSQTRPIKTRHPTHLPQSNADIAQYNHLLLAISSNFQTKNVIHYPALPGCLCFSCSP